MITEKDVEGTRTTCESLAALCEKLGYGKAIKQLQFNNGAYVSSILDYFDDNPGAIEAVLEFIRENSVNKREECQACGCECDKHDNCENDECDNFGKNWTAPE